MLAKYRLPAGRNSIEMAGKKRERFPFVRPRFAVWLA